MGHHIPVTSFPPLVLLAKHWPTGSSVMLLRASDPAGFSSGLCGRCTSSRCAKSPACPRSRDACRRPGSRCRRTPSFHRRAAACGFASRRTRCRQWSPAYAPSPIWHRRRLGLHTEELVVAFLRLAHFRIALLVAVLGRWRRRDQGRVDDSPLAHHQAFAGQVPVDFVEDPAR